MSDDPSNHAEFSLMVGSQFAFTNVPRNLVIISLLISISGISLITAWAFEESNSDWEPVEAQILDTGVSSSWCGGVCLNNVNITDTFQQLNFHGKLTGWITLVMIIFAILQIFLAIPEPNNG